MHRSRSRLQFPEERRRAATEYTVRFYEENARNYIASTRDLAISREVYAPFLERLPSGGKVLDAGCGSGRDARYLMEQGLQVEALDASAELAREASRYLGIPVRMMRHQEVEWEREFDGIWACASLLHVAAAEMGEVLARYARALHPEGVLYASYKWGEGERRDERGRHFTDYTEASFREMMQQVPELSVEYLWQTGDTQARAGTLWLNAILRKQAERVV